MIGFFLLFGLVKKTLKEQKGRGSTRKGRLKTKKRLKTKRGA